jgi:hypothetical protein
MANGWTLERRARQAELIKTWSPWKHSTGPRSSEGKVKSSRNAWKDGHRALLRALTEVMRNQEVSMATWSKRRH